MCIDDKLRETVGAIIYDGYKNGVTTPTEPWVKNLKQAFADEEGRKVALHVKTKLMTHKGYDTFEKTWTPQIIKPRNKLFIPLDARGSSFVQVELINEGEDLMTGQEFYDRFSNEFRGTPAGTIVTLSVDEIMKAAKRAAGIKDD